jgi:hypothetical protein
MVVLFSLAPRVEAQVTEVWIPDQADSLWNDSSNWSDVAPTMSDTAEFSYPSSDTSPTPVTVSGTCDAGALQFDSTAGPYALTIPDSTSQLNISGAGVIDNSGTTQIIYNEAGGTLSFSGASTAGDLTIFNTDGTHAGNIVFSGSSSAASATINNFSGSSNQGGDITFNDNSTAGSVTINSNLAWAGDAIAFNDNSSAANMIFNGLTTINFSGSSTAGNASITSAGYVQFYGNSSAGNSVITDSGGISLYFSGNSTANNAQVILNGGNWMNCIGHTGPLSVGMVTTDNGQPGTIATGTNILTVGGINMSGTFYGNIEEGAGNGTDTTAGFTKIGTGTFVKTGGSINLYGPITVSGGTLVIDGASETDSIVLNTGGTLQVDWTDNINSAATAIFNGGTLNMVQWSQSLGPITLSLGSTINYGDTPGITAQFSDITSWNGILNLANFEVGSDELNFSNTSGFTNWQDITTTYNGMTYAGSGVDGSGNVIFSVVPEPATWVTFGFGLAAMLVISTRRRRSLPMGH